jgi:alpha-ketoglutarate-dependent taurine dioxygenase
MKYAGAIPLTVQPLDAPLGAVIQGFDFSLPMEPETRDALQKAVDEHLLLLFRNGDRPPSHADIVSFCTAFGDLKLTLADQSRLPDQPYINLVSNQVVDGVQGTGSNGTVTWHSDLNFVPPLVEMLFLDALSVTSTGGTTKWTNLRAAYDALDPELAARLDAMAVRYGLRTDLDFTEYFRSTGELTMPATEISLVQVNPRNGRKAVWPNTGPDFTAAIIGLSAAESDELLDALYRHATQPQFVYEHHWQVGDAVFWLNNQTMHERGAFPDNESRVMRHVNILGVTDPHQRRPVSAARTD